MLALDLQEGMTGRHNYCLPMHHLKSNTLLPDLLTAMPTVPYPDSTSNTQHMLHTGFTLSTYSNLPTMQIRDPRIPEDNSRSAKAFQELQKALSK